MVGRKMAVKTRKGHRLPGLFGNPCFMAGFLLLVFLAVMHFFDVRDGVMESGDGWLLGRYLLVCASAMAVSSAAGGLLFLEKRRLEHIFFALALCLGLLFLYVLPPLSAPDEVRHYISAYRLSNYMLGISDYGGDGRVPVRLEDWFAEDPCGDYEAELDENGVFVVPENHAGGAKVLGEMLTEESYALIHDYAWGQKDRYREMAEDGGSASLKGKRRGSIALSIHAPVATTPLAYLMPAAGITIARLLGLNTLWLLILGRVFNLLFFAICVSLAIRRLPFGKEVMFGVGLLPMTLHLAASYSYDVLLICGIFLFTAICLDLAYAAKRVRLADIFLLAGIMAVAGPCKMVYAVFMGLCLLIPVRKFGGWGKWAASAGCVLGSWAVAMALVNSQTLASYASGTGNFIDWAQEEGYTLAHLWHEPLRVFRLFFNTVIWQGETWHLTMLGAYLGNVDLVLDVPYLLILGLSLGLLALALKKPGESVMAFGQRAWIWALCLACVGALMFSMFLAWTPLSSRIVCGVQGRYFLPFLPILLLTLKNGTIVLTKDVNRSILYLMCCADAYVLMRIFAIVCMRL